LLTRIGPGQERVYTARTLLTRRGAFPLGPTRLTTSDPFGLFPRTWVFPARETLIVLPMAFPVSQFTPPVGLLPGGKAIRLRTGDVTPHAAGVREYVPGDPMKRIHWPSTAHRSRFMVKEFEQDPQAEIWLFLDAQAQVQSKRLELPEVPREEGLWLRRPRVQLPGDTFEYAVSAAASLAKHFLSQRRVVGLACSSARFLILPSERGERQIGKVMEALAFVQPDGTLPLAGLVNMQERYLPFGSGAILITPSTSLDLLAVAEELKQRSLQVVVVLLLAETFGGRQGGAELAASLRALGIPVCTLQFGDDLAGHLSLAGTEFQWSSRWETAAQDPGMG
jgi:uncharacterized protein (DUF58 family)